MLEMFEPTKYNLGTVPEQERVSCALAKISEWNKDFLDIVDGKSGRM